MENEAELIRKFEELEEKIFELKYKKQALEGLTKQDEDVRSDIIKTNTNIEQLQSEQNEIGNLLQGVDEKGMLNKKVSALRRLLSEIIAHLRLSKTGLPLSRNQGTIVDNFIYGKILTDIDWTFKSEFGSSPVPEFFFQSGGDFNHNPLKKYLQEKQAALNSKEFDNYLDFRTFVNDLKGGIKIIWEKDNSNLKPNSK